MKAIITPVTGDSIPEQTLDFGDIAPTWKELIHKLGFVEDGMWIRMETLEGVSQNIDDTITNNVAFCGIYTSNNPQPHPQGGFYNGHPAFDVIFV